MICEGGSRRRAAARLPLPSGALLPAAGQPLSSTGQRHFFPPPGGLFPLPGSGRPDIFGGDHVHPGPGHIRKHHVPDLYGSLHANCL